jgi:hypothetical protein
MPGSFQGDVNFVAEYIFTLQAVPLRKKNSFCPRFKIQITHYHVFCINACRQTLHCARHIIPKNNVRCPPGTFVKAFFNICRGGYDCTRINWYRNQYGTRQSAPYRYGTTALRIRISIFSSVALKTPKKSNLVLIFLQQ